jgi:threonine dehydrogenase-like Zn-dependent dehydrogenase
MSSRQCHLIVHRSSVSRPKMPTLNQHGLDGAACATAADVNLLKLPETDPDEKWLYLSDILPTAWHANVLAETGEGKTVAIWGAGPGGTADGVHANCCGLSPLRQQTRALR